MNIDTDKLVKILETELPYSGFMVEENNKEKVFVFVCLPQLADKVVEFAKTLNQ